MNTDMLVGMCKVFFLGRVQLLEMMADDRCCAKVRTKIPILDATFYLVVQTPTWGQALRVVPFFVINPDG